MHSRASLRTRHLTSLLLALTLPATAQAQRSAQPLSAAELKAYPDARGLPADVQHFIMRHDDCLHWAGEEPYDADRRREIERGVATACTGLDASAVTLRHRYAKNMKIRATLRNYEAVGQ
jgi:hypothetical protein